MQLIENVLLITAPADAIGNAPVRAILPFINLIAKQQGLKHNRLREFNICKKILYKSINLN